MRARPNSVRVFVLHDPPPRSQERSPPGSSPPRGARVSSLFDQTFGASEESPEGAAAGADMTPGMIRRLETLTRECAVLEGRLQFRSDNQIKELEHARAERVAMTQAGRRMRTRTRPTLNLLHHLRASV